MRVDGQMFNSVTFKSGVRQGCLLSPLLFALCADVLLKEVDKLLSGHEVVKAFADDTACVVADYAVTLPALSRLFAEFEAISALSLNIKKTVFIPLRRQSCNKNVQALIREICPAWRDMHVSSSGKYFGFIIGPGAKLSSWDKPLNKYALRAELWSSFKLGLTLNAVAHRVFIASVLSYVMQLEADPADLQIKFEFALRRLAPGPGNWIALADLTHLCSCFHFH
ncbi:unnamed protein product [Polarella glacialis]|uniref:Reverse transcriptase domain-containing protein n=1 Tax=Polarella glacialis TaxID=89957 RepID=A0A813GA82_POLGL|nr:unnamed protein product [Polarella glacialis]